MHLLDQSKMSLENADASASPEREHARRAVSNSAMGESEMPNDRVMPRHTVKPAHGQGAWSATALWAGARCSYARCIVTETSRNHVRVAPSRVASLNAGASRLHFVVPASERF